MNEAVNMWMQRAESAFQMALIDKKETIFYEDLCFQLQQAVEKAINGYLIYNNVEPPRTHALNCLFKKSIKLYPLLPKSKEQLIWRIMRYKHGIRETIRLLN